MVIATLYEFYVLDDFPPPIKILEKRATSSGNIDALNHLF